MREHNGLYRGIVVSNADPEGKMRITAQVPDVLGETVSNWALPATIIDGPPEPGEAVWIQYPNGDFRYPVYHRFHDPKKGRIIPGNSQLAVDGPGAAGIVLDSNVHARKSSGGYVEVHAADFIKVSSQRLKTDIRNLDFDPVQAVQNAPAYRWRRLVDGREGIGPLREDLPAVTHVGASHVSEGSLVGILWEAVRQLSKRVADLEHELSILKNDAAPNTLENDV